MPDAAKLAFLDIRYFDDGRAMRGAALATDLKTEPIEFRCTDVLRPTNIQRVLWGSRLAGHVATHLMGKTLLQKLENKPQLIVVRCGDFLELRPLIDTPLILVLRHEELATVPAFVSQDDDDLLDSAGGRFEPLILKTHVRHADDRTLARELLTETSRAYNLLEPFDRIANAVEMIAEHESPNARK